MQLARGGILFRGAHMVTCVDKDWKMQCYHRSGGLSKAYTLLEILSPIAVFFIASLVYTQEQMPCQTKCLITRVSLTNTCQATSAGRPTMYTCHL